MHCLADRQRKRPPAAAAPILPWVPVSLRASLWALLWALLALCAPGRPALASEREDFALAERALQSGDTATYESLRAGLQGYALYPYLRFAELTRDLDATPDAAIEAFLADYPDTPLALRLRAAYLKRLVQAGRWSDYARIYRPDDSTERRCLYLRALLALGRGPEALDPKGLDPLWLVPRPQPAACEPLFDAWAAAGGLDRARVWARIRLAMEAGEPALARRLGERLPEPERVWLARWLAVQAHPEQVADPATLAGSHPLRAAILADGLARLARRDPVRAADALEAAVVAGSFVADADPAAWDQAHRSVGRALVQDRDPAGQERGLAIWDRMSAGSANLPDQEARVRAALGLAAWAQVADWIARMPDGDEKRDRWLYWQGRAELAMGLASQGQETLRLAAARRSLWGFLAADRLGLPYNLADKPTPVEPARLARIDGHPALARIRELKPLGRETDMRREWRTLIRDLDAPDLMAAAVVAQGLGWPDRAIFALARTAYWDDLGLRFPLLYRDQVAERSWQTGLPEDWILAVIRQESVFDPQAASPVGALGLMQLMPATARELAQDPDLKPDLALDGAQPNQSVLLDPARNIVLGSAYLAQMRDRFGHAALATAAYNAGPHRVARWLPERCMEADLWIAAIPFDETRGYVERVLAYRVIYESRLGELEPQRLSEMLPPVSAAPGGERKVARED